MHEFNDLDVVVVCMIVSLEFPRVEESLILVYYQQVQRDQQHMVMLHEKGWVMSLCNMER
jgi:hypothetical protein